MAIILVPPVDAPWLNIITAPNAIITLPKIVASIKLSVIATGVVNFSIIDIEIDNPKAAYALFTPKLPPKNIKAKMNNTILHNIITIPGSILNTSFIISANPETPPEAMEFEKKKYSNAIAVNKNPIVINIYSLNFFICFSYFSFVNYSIFIKPSPITS